MNNAFKNTISTILFILLVIILLLFITSRFPLIYGIRSYDILTGSMEPAIPVGGLVISKPSSFYNVGNIITFNRGNIVVTHRISSIKNGEYFTKGDANKIVDTQPLSKSAIIGKVYMIVPYLGMFITFLKTVPGFIIFIVIPTLVFVVFEAMEFKKEWEKEVEKKLLKKIKEPSTT